MGTIGCPETSVRNYHYWLHNNPEERSSQEVNFPCLLMMMIIWVVQTVWSLDYEIDNLGFGVQFSAGTRDFFSSIMCKPVLNTTQFLSNGHRRPFFPLVNWPDARSETSTENKRVSSYAPLLKHLDDIMFNCLSQMKHQLDATLCRFYFCRVTLHVSGASAHHQEYLN